ncbi:MAG TPA: ATP-binding cassette domain-containing protein [Polyangiaceae bacterium]|nr:ATP-binding cassette domain-containing protein [Polyangiaceae bacterium]
MMVPAILVENLGKTYTRRKRKAGFWAGLRAYLSTASERVAAVTELSFRIERGESVGLIGENGAGKSTTVKMLTGILVPSEGRVETLGVVPWRERRRLAQNMGVVFGQKPQILWDIPARESFRLLKAMYAIPNEVFRFTYDEAVERLELGEFLDTPVRLLSLGQRMRCDLAASLLHAPAVAFLDEPTIGLDVLVKERVREHLIEMRRRFGTTIVLTTHDLKDISATCERLLVLDRGRLLYDGSRQGFEERFAHGRTLLVELGSEADASTRSALEHELAGDEVTFVWDTPHRLRVECARSASAPKVTASVLEHLHVADLAVHGAELDAIVTRLYRTAKAPA